MLFDSFNLMEGSEVENLSIATGTAFPDNPNTGELYFRTDGVYLGLHVYQSGAWSKIAGVSDIVQVTSGNVISALGFTPIPASGAPVQSVNSKTGSVALVKADIGLTDVEDKSSATIRSELTVGNVNSALGFTPKINSAYYVGTWDPSTNTPALASGIGQPGAYYKVAVQKIGGIPVPPVYGTAQTGGSPSTSVGLQGGPTSTDGITIGMTMTFHNNGNITRIVTYAANGSVLWTGQAGVATNFGDTYTFTAPDAPLDGTSDFYVGDLVVFNGTTWDKVNGGSEVISVSGKTGAVALVVADVTGAAPLASPALTGTPTAPTAISSDNSTVIATTAFIKNQGYVTSAQSSSGAPVQSVSGKTGAVALVVADVTGAAPLASPALTGTPTAPNVSANDNSTKIANTRYVENAVIASSGTGAWSRKTSNYTAVPNNKILADTSGGAFTITLPSTPVQFATVGPILDAAGTFSTANLTIAGNGEVIMGINEPMTVSTNNISFSLIYDNPTNGWRIL